MTTLARRIFLITCLLASAFNIATASSINSTYIAVSILPDGEVDPPTAPISRIGNIYTLSSNLHGSIKIQRNNTILDGNDYVIEGNSTGQGIELRSVENVTIRNLHVKLFTYGFQITDSPQSRISANFVANCTYGILADNSPQLNVTKNMIQSNLWDGIFITGSPKSTLTNNTVQDHTKWGVYLGFSQNTTLKHNRISANGFNLGVSTEYALNIDATNTVNNKPIYYWINQEDKNIPQDAGYVALVNSSNISLRNLNLSRNGHGILMVNSTGNKIENLELTGNGYFGIQLINSHLNTIRNTTITLNEMGGIAFISSTDNLVTNNTLRDNDKGIYLFQSENNWIYHNNFVNNTMQVFTDNSINTWDSGYPSAGNFWSDYTGKDTNEDRIGDAPYRIDANNLDNHPLMTPFNKAETDSGTAQPNILNVAIMAAVGVSVAALAVIANKWRHRKIKDETRESVISKIDARYRQFCWLSHRSMFP